MKMLKGILVIFCLALTSKATAKSALSITKITEFANTWLGALQSISFLIDELQPKDKMPQEIIDAIHEVSAQLDQIGVHLDERLDILSINIPKQVSALTRIDRDIEDLIKNMRTVNYYYKTFYVNMINTTFSNYTIQSFVETCISLTVDQSPRRAIANIYSHFNDPESESIRNSMLHEIINTLQTESVSRCNEFQSPQQWLFDVYSLVAVVELRAMIMITSAYKIHSNTTGENHDGDMTMVKNQYIERMNSYLNIMKQALPLMPGDIRRCDSDHPVTGGTYIEMSKFVQKVIINADQISVGETCQGCDSFNDVIYTTRRPTLWGKPLLQLTCNGVVQSCTTWESTYYRFPLYHQISVCLLGTRRRYQYFTDAEGRSSGDTSGCRGKVVQDMPLHYCPMPVDGRLIYPNRCLNSACHHCLCTCIEGGTTSDALRKFDVSLAQSDCQNNRVVIGAQVYLTNGVIRLAVKEGKLIPGGRIEPGSEVWVSVHRDVVEASMGYSHPNDHTMAMHLANVFAPSNESYVITGIGFSVVHRYGNTKAIGLKIKTNRIDLSTGTIDCQDGRVIDSDDPSRQQQSSSYDVDIKDAESSLKSSVNLPYSNAEFVEFQSTNVKKDAGQTVIPMLALDTIDSRPSFPLGGIGLYHKGRPGFGGYVALKIFTLNMGDFIESNTK